MYMLYNYSMSVLVLYIIMYILYNYSMSVLVLYWCESGRPNNLVLYNYVEYRYTRTQSWGITHYLPYRL